MIGEIYKPVSTGITYPFTYLQLFLLIWLSEQLFDDRRNIEHLMIIFIISNISAVLISLLDYNLVTQSGQINQLAGLAGNSNEFGIYLSFSILMVVYFVGQVTKKFVQVLLILAAIGLGISLLLSGSRGSILFLIPVLLLQLLRLYNKRIFLILFIIATMVFAIIFVQPYIPAGFFQRMINIPAGILSGSDTIGERYSLWQYGLVLWAKNPILGIGSGMFQYYSIDSSLLHGTKTLMAHNAYITYLTENGIIGLLLFLLISIYSFINYEHAIRINGKDFHNKALAVTWEAIMLCILLNTIKGNWGDNKILWFCFGISMISCQLLKCKDDKKLERPQQADIYLAGLQDN
jgi:O-antigen ligase